MAKKTHKENNNTRKEQKKKEKNLAGTAKKVKSRHFGNHHNPSPYPSAPTLLCHMQVLNNKMVQRTCLAMYVCMYCPGKYVLPL